MASAASAPARGVVALTLDTPAAAVAMLTLALARAGEAAPWAGAMAGAVASAATVTA